MPDSEVEFVTKEWLQSELRSASKDLILLDCRSAHDYAAGHVRTAANFSIPSIMLRRLATGKIEITAAIKCRDLRRSLFVLYNDGDQVPVPSGGAFNVNDVVSVLYRRLKEDECRVVFLQGELGLRVRGRGGEIQPDNEVRLRNYHPSEERTSAPFDKC